MLLRRFAESGGRRAVMVGTCAEYAWGLGDGVCYEDSTPLIPATRYGIGKHRLHLASATTARETGVSLAWVRLFQLYGPGENPHRLAPSVIQALLRGETASCSAGRQVRDFVHVTDVAYAIAALLAIDFQGPVNIGSGIGISVREFVETISAEFSQTQQVTFGTKPLLPGEPSTLVADVTRLRATIGSWNPICMSRGIKDTVAWWQSVEKKRDAPR
jgi:nucleoside-diphosphate-sugar epimerase